MLGNFNKINPILKLNKFKLTDPIIFLCEKVYENWFTTNKMHFEVRVYCSIIRPVRRKNTKTNKQ